MRRANDRLRRSSLQMVLAVSFTAITAAALVVICASMYFRFSDMFVRQISEDNKRILTQVNYNFDSYLRGMMQVSDTIYYSVIKNADFKTDSIAETMNALYETNQADLVSIAVFGKDGSLVYAVPQSTLKEGIDPTEQVWFQDATDRIENLHFSTPHVQNVFADPGSSPRWVVSLSRAVELTYGGEIRQGVLLIDMDFSGVRQVCKNVSLGESGYAYLIDGEGQIIYHPNQQLVSSGLLMENNRVAAAYEDGNHVERYLGVSRMVTVKAVGYTGWKIVGVMPMSDITANYFPNNLYVVVLVLFAITLMALVNVFISARIVVPIKTLEQSVKELEGGNLDARIFIGGSYEVQHLGQAICAMATQMRRLMADVVHEQEQKRVSELAVLQSQINPHFLYNTLDSIIWMIENCRYNGAITMVTSLARLFRISLSRGKAIINVETELQHARSYLTIQEMRYKNKFSTEIVCDEGAGNMQTIKLIVQPLLENAIYHGMEYQDGDGEICVHAYVLGDDLYIDVCDNGPGIPPEIVKTLLTCPSKQGKGSGVALCNVHERIRLTYGPAYGLTIQSEPDEGTTIQIHLPANREEAS